MHSPETVRSTPCYQLAPTAIPCEAADWFDPLSSHYNKLFRSLLLLSCCSHGLVVGTRCFIPLI